MTTTTTTTDNRKKRPHTEHDEKKNVGLWTVAHEINVWYWLGKGECAEDYTLRVEELLARGKTDIFAVSRDGEPLEQLFKQMHARLEEDSLRRRGERRSMPVIRDLQAQVLRIAALIEAAKKKRARDAGA